MFRSYGKELNPKVEFKFLYFLIPNLDREKDYYEIVDIFKKNIEPKTYQGKWFLKIKKIYERFSKNQTLTKELFEYLNQEFNWEIDYSKVDELISEYKNLDYPELDYKATWLLKNIICKNPIDNYSYIIAIVLFNALLKANGKFPIIFTLTYLEFVQRMIKTNITLDSLYELISIYKDLSVFYDTKYPSKSKEDVIRILNDNRQMLIKTYGFKKVWLYGSFVRNEQTDFSDIDIYVDFSKEISSQEYIDIKEYLKSILERSIDLHVGNKEFSAFLRNILKERELVFDAAK